MATRGPGLTTAEARERLRGRAPMPSRSTRTYRSIVATNVFTLFNAILTAFGVLTLALGNAQDALFLGIVVANAAIGIAQEVRAKRALDRLGALVAPRAIVVRDGEPREVGADDVVEGDLLRFGAGDQLVADGRLLEGAGVQLDESPLTGESRPVGKEAGDTLLSGSFVLEGSGSCLVEAAGADSFAARIVGQAKEDRHIRSPLEQALNRLLVALVIAMVPLSLVLGGSLLARSTSVSDAVPKATAAMVSLVPEGLILLASLTFAVAAARLAARGALAQRLNAIESLAGVDVLCLDKTGTLTESRLRVIGVRPVAGVDAAAVEQALAAYGATVSRRNLSAEAIADAFPGEAIADADEVPFVSRRRWSAVGDASRSIVLGAPDVLLGRDDAAAGEAEAAQGRRVIAVAEGEPLAGRDPDDGPPVRRPLGHVAIAELLRDDTRETVAYLRSQGVELRVLSGDDPATVASIAADAGIPNPSEPVDGRALPAGAEALAAFMDTHAVIGRVAPDDKRRIVEALAGAGRYVGFIGDGVNDVPALKAARLAIAQGSGAQMAKSVADVVLVRSGFANIPPMIEEGRRILRNVQRVAKLFVTKSALAAVLIVTVGTTSSHYPFLPRHLTVASTFGVGVPAFFLALAPSSGTWRAPRFLQDVIRFSLVAGTALAVGVLAAYGGAKAALGLEDARTAATTVLLAGLLVVMVALEGEQRRRRRAVEALALVMAGGYVVFLAIAPLRRFFGLVAPGPTLLAITLGAIAVTAVLVRVGVRYAARS